MKKLAVYLKKYIVESILGPLFKLFEASLELIVPLVVAALIDNGIGNGDRGYVLKMCLILAGFALAGLLASVTAQFFAAKAATGFSTELRSSLFAHIQKLSFSTLDSQGADTLITRMTGDVNQLQSGVNLSLRLLLRSPFIVFGAMIMAFTVDVKSALVFAVLIPVLFVAVFVILLTGIPMFKKVQNATDKITGKTRENLTGVRVVRAFGREEAETEEFETRTDVLERLQVKASNFTALMNPLTYVIVNLGLVVLIYKGSVRVSLGAISQGQVVALVNYMSQILVELIKMANLIITITKSVASGKRVTELLELPEGMPVNDAPAAETEKADNPEKGNPADNQAAVAPLPVVSFKNATVRYHKGADESLKNVSFDVFPGDTVGVIGGTGSGKTTLVSLIPRFYDVEEGSVSVLGKDVRAWDPQELKKRVVTVLQKPVLFKGTIRENLIWGNENATDAELIDALRAAQAFDFVMDKPGGLDAVVEQEGRNFSGGQRQRLSVARALATKPDVLILDDSSSALDYATDAAMRKAVSERFADTTLFIVSQRAKTLTNADRIIVLEDGNAVGIGKHEELLENCEIYREIYNA